MHKETPDIQRGGKLSVNANEGQLWDKLGVAAKASLLRVSSWR